MSMTSSLVTQRISVLGLALSFAILGALVAFFWVVLALYVPNAGVTILRSFVGFLGFTISWPGAFILAAIAFVESFVFGAVLAMLYNILSSGK